MVVKCAKCGEPIYKGQTYLHDEEENKYYHVWCSMNREPLPGEIDEEQVKLKINIDESEEEQQKKLEDAVKKKQKIETRLKMLIGNIESLEKDMPCKELQQAKGWLKYLLKRIEKEKALP